MNSEEIEEVEEMGTPVMPFYIVCDTSGSMTRYMGTLNDYLGRLIKEIAGSPSLERLVRIGLVSFNSYATEVTPLNEPAKIVTNGLPTLSATGGTNYGDAFRKIKELIERDMAALKANSEAKVELYRPAVFFLTDGYPGDQDWKDTFNLTLTYNKATGVGMKRHPIVFAIGFDQARQEVLETIAYPANRGAWYFVSGDMDKMIKAIVKAITKSIMDSAKSLGTADAGMKKPQIEGVGVRQGAPAYDDDRISLS